VESAWAAGTICVPRAESAIERHCSRPGGDVKSSAL
jgi:hypothetical protein